MTEESYKDLPDECWELIFNRLHLQSHQHYNLESPSLACKRFLSITNNLRTHFTIVDPTVLPLSKIFNRFPRLHSIDLSSFRGGDDLHRVIIDIANSNLNLESLDFSEIDRLPLDSLKILGLRAKNLKVLMCSNLRTLRDIELFVVADSMPFLEDLDISYPVNDFGWDPTCEAWSPAEVAVTDHGIEVLSSKLRGLRKIDISGNGFLTDKSLLAISTNCVYLEEIVVLNCWLISANGIEFVMRNNPKLTSVSVQGIEFCSRLDHHSVCFAQNLSIFCLYDSVVPDEYLHLLVKAGLPLRRFSLDQCRSSFTFSGISYLLNEYRSLQNLSLTGIEFLTDHKISDLSRCLSAVVTISLDLCFKLTESTFFTLAKNCPLLQSIDMGRTDIGGGNGAADLVKNPTIKNLNLAFNSNLSDQCLAKVALVCPSLEVLDVSSCKGITEKGIADFLNGCSKIRILRINKCVGIKNIGNGFKLSKLEVIGAGRSGINDSGLVLMGKRCGELQDLNLDGCLGVTTIGLKEILTNCKRLRELNLNGLVNISTGIVDWMVFSRPSLRKIILPYSSLPSESKRKFFLRHGCLVLSE